MNHGHDIPAYGLWTLVLINSGIVIIFAFSFFKPKSKRDWRTFGSFSGFVIALFVEMYGFPSSIFLLSGWLAQKLPRVDFWSHDAGDLGYRVLGFEGDPHGNPLHILSNVLIVAGFFLLPAAWRVLFKAQRTATLATGDLTLASPTCGWPTVAAPRCWCRSCKYRWHGPARPAP